MFVCLKRSKHFGFPKLKISYSTVHGSKGLEQDFVILISGEDAQNGFPNKMEDDNGQSCIPPLLVGRQILPNHLPPVPAVTLPGKGKGR